MTFDPEQSGTPDDHTFSVSERLHMVAHMLVFVCY